MRHILDAIEARADSAAFAALQIPESYRAAVVLKSEQEIFAGVPSNQKDPRKTVHIQDVPVPDIAPDEALIAVMASSINFNTVWSSIFEPVSTFGSLTRLARESSWA
ncbi:MAG: crotonyl-CoA carboxylase/reductase, partial [Actinomycetota bacterium]